MIRKVFFSFDFDRDMWRVRQIYQTPYFVAKSAAGFDDPSLWEEIELKGEVAVRTVINKALEDTTVTVVCLGLKTFSRKYVHYAVEQSLNRGNGLLGIQIHHLKDELQRTDPAGKVLPQIENAGFKVFKYLSMEQLIEGVEEAAMLARR